MMRAARYFLLAGVTAWSAAGIVAPPVTHAQGGGAAVDEGLELIDPKVLRVCADPNNLPYSNEKGEGFENKLAELFAAKLGKRLAYTFYPQATGFVRMTLGSHRCDVIMGYPQGDSLVLNTNPYYQTSYAIVAKADSPLRDVDTLSDPRLKDKHLGIVAGTPPSTYFVTDGLMVNARPYPLMVDTRVDSSPQAMTNDIESGAIDAGVLWGPIAGYYAAHAHPPMHAALLLKDSGGPRLTYRITMGVRPSDQNWKRQLNQLIADNQTEIDKLLLDYGVPLLDRNGQPVAPASGGTAAGGAGTGGPSTPKP